MELRLREVCVEHINYDHDVHLLAATLSLFKAKTQICAHLRICEAAYCPVAWATEDWMKNKS